MSMFVAKDPFSLPTSAWNCGVVVDGEIVVGGGVALLQVEGHPGELDDVAGRPHDHPATVHPVRILLGLRDRDEETFSEASFRDRLPAEESLSLPPCPSRFLRCHCTP